MQILISVISLEEAKIALKGGTNILDIKNPDEGSLGAQFPWILKQIATEAKDNGVICSAALGDLPYKPGTISLAAYGAACCGIDYIKAGMMGAKNYQEAYEMAVGMVEAVRMANTNAFAVVSGYADYDRIGSVSCSDLVKAASNAGADVVMIDTAIKDGKNLMEILGIDKIKAFINAGHDEGLKVALAGSIKKEHLEVLADLGADVIGVRGAVCGRFDRKAGLEQMKVRALMDAAIKLQVRPHSMLN